MICSDISRLAWVCAMRGSVVVGLGLRWGTGVVDLPRQRRPQIGILGQQVVEDRRAGARLADDDDRAGDRRRSPPRGVRCASATICRRLVRARRMSPARDLHPQRREPGLVDQSVGQPGQPVAPAVARHRSRRSRRCRPVRRPGRSAGRGRSVRRASVPYRDRRRWRSRRAVADCRASAGRRSRGAGHRCPASGRARNPWRRWQFAPCRRRRGAAPLLVTRTVPALRLDALVPDALQRDVPVAGVGRCRYSSTSASLRLEPEGADHVEVVRGGVGGAEFGGLGGRPARWGW